METFSTLKLMVAAPPEALSSLTLPEGALVAHMAYRLEDGPALYRSANPEQLRGGVLMAEDSRLEEIGNTAFLCRQAVRECRARGFSGFIANWSRPPTEALCRMTGALEQALTQAQLSYWVPERYGKCVKRSNILISSAISGGTLRQRLTEAMERWGKDRITIAIERMSEDFTLPARSGNGTPLTGEALDRLMKRLRPSVYYSSELCAHYFTYSNNRQVHFVLFDTPSSIRKKLLLAQDMGVKWGLGVWEELGQEVLASKRQ